MIIASYNQDLYENPAYFIKCVNRTVEKLRPHADKFQSIAFRGTSGAMIAPAVAAALNKSITLVRKDDGHHEIGPISGRVNMAGYLILDDMIASGGTVRVIQNMLSVSSPMSKCVGIYLWYSDILGIADDASTEHWVRNQIKS